MSSDRILTGGVWISGNCILDLSSTSKIDRDDRGTFAIFQGSGNVKSILPELVVCGSYEVTAELDGCKRVKSIKNKPGGLRVARPVKN